MYSTETRGKGLSGWVTGVLWGGGGQRLAAINVISKHAIYSQTVQLFNSVIGIKAERKQKTSAVGGCCERFVQEIIYLRVTRPHRKQKEAEF